ncbi:hypothetical protein HZB96_00420, partial [Candidatus Gottesmanbacteria bacterium]|nr:hypothetical protein [Candidatus Gottesmanbacteria bacterium]
MIYISFPTGNKIHIFLAILLIYLAVSFYRIDSLPGEWFGDISNVHEYVTQILEGKWPFYFFQSPGPLDHYLIAPIILALGQSFLSYKIASII